VDPGFQQLALARALLGTSAGAAADHDLKPVLDVVADSAPAVALYERAGWQLAGIHPLPGPTGRHRPRHPLLCRP